VEAAGNEGEQPGAARPGTLAAFSSRDFRLLWTGQTISFVGDAAFVIAVGWRVTALTKSAGSLGFVLAAESVAMLATLLWGGVLADRYPRRLLMISSDLARAGSRPNRSSACGGSSRWGSGT
jgi:MFS family permease